MLLLLSTAAHAEIYKWVDDRGRTHYSQTPPLNRGVQVEKIEQKKMEGISSQPAPREGIDRYNRFLESERLERAEKREQRNNELAERREKCDHLRKKLSDYQTGGVVYYDLDENGERVYWNERRLNQERDKLNRQIQQNCKDM